MKYLLIIIILLWLVPAKACECLDYEYSGKHVRQFFHWHDKVFIGNLLENNQGVYKFEVVKGFKNCEFRDTFWGKFNNSCSIIPKEKGLWIVYASIQDSITNEIDIEECNSTRSLKSNRNYLHEGYDTDSDAYNLKNEQASNLVELSILEQLTRENSTIQRIKNKNQPTSLRKEENNNWLNLIAIALAIIAILMNLQFRKELANNK